MTLAVNSQPILTVQDLQAKWSDDNLVGDMNLVEARFDIQFLLDLVESLKVCGSCSSFINTDASDSGICEYELPLTLKEVKRTTTCNNWKEMDR